MTTDDTTQEPYTPTDEHVRTMFVEGASEDYYAMSWHEPFAEAYDRWLAAHDARVARDAAREALDGLIDTADAWASRADNHTAKSIYLSIAGFAEGHRDTHYPETEG